MTQPATKVAMRRGGDGAKVREVVDGALVGADNLVQVRGRGYEVMRSNPKTVTVTGELGCAWLRGGRCWSNEPPGAARTADQDTGREPVRGRG